jgi:predicted Mrr-cat superfamily restriction endonuclease
VPIQQGTALLLGQVTGDYRFEGRELLPHRRPVRWAGIAPRAAAPRPATLQDPRALFSVLLDPAALDLAGLVQRCD